MAINDSIILETLRNGLVSSDVGTILRFPVEPPRFSVRNADAPPPPRDETGFTYLSYILRERQLASRIVFDYNTALVFSPNEEVIRTLMTRYFINQLTSVLNNELQINKEHILIKEGTYTVESERKVDKFVLVGYALVRFWQSQ